jgi:hypothetical protein
MITNNNTTSFPNTVTITAPNTVPNYGYYTGTSTTTGVNPIWTINPSNTSNTNQLTVKGDAEFEGEVTIKGKSLLDTIESLEKRLGLLQPNPKLEGRWEELKELGERYRALEKEILEKEKMWAILQK